MSVQLSHHKTNLVMWPVGYHATYTISGKFTRWVAALGGGIVEAEREGATIQFTTDAGEDAWRAGWGFPSVAKRRRELAAGGLVEGLTGWEVPEGRGE